MDNHMIDCGHGFWSIRGSMKIGGLIDVGTHCSLIRRPDGSFVFLDSYTLPDDILARVYQMTDHGAKVAAVVNLHPFHTLHCEWMHRTFPQAKFYGTRRHHDRLPDLPWEKSLCEGDAMANLFGDILEFSLPRGVELVCASEAVHFGSILAYHPASRTIHVDDTLSFLDAPFPLSLFPIAQRLAFHPTLAQALKPEPGAAAAFREWAIDVGTDWAGALRIATAHNALVAFEEGGFPEAIGKALGKVAPVLAAHRRKFGAAVAQTGA